MFETTRAKLGPLMLVLTAITFSPGTCSPDLALLAGAGDEFGYVAVSTDEYTSQPYYVVEDYYYEDCYSYDTYYEDTYLYDAWAWDMWW